MKLYAVLTEKNCITGKEYVPCGTFNWTRLDGRLGIAGAIACGREQYRKALESGAGTRVVIVKGELNRPTPLRVLGSFPAGEKSALQDIINS